MDDLKHFLKMLNSSSRISVVQYFTIHLDGNQRGYHLIFVKSQTGRLRASSFEIRVVESMDCYASLNAADI